MPGTTLYLFSYLILTVHYPIRTILISQLEKKAARG